jgi:hypothetical protein
MDMTTITAAQESIKALFGLAKLATSAAIDHELKARLIEIQSAILETQSKLGDAHSERMHLLQQVADLRETVRRLETAKAALVAYKLHEVAPGKFLYKYILVGEDSVDHFACPTCYDAGSVTVLQWGPSASKQTCYYCQTCKFKLYVGPSDPPRPVRNQVFSSRDW